MLCSFLLRYKTEFSVSLHNEEQRRLKKCAKWGKELPGLWHLGRSTPLDDTEHGCHTSLDCSTLSLHLPLILPGPLVRAHNDYTTGAFQKFTMCLGFCSKASFLCSEKGLKWLFGEEDVQTNCEAFSNIACHAQVCRLTIWNLCRARRDEAYFALHSMMPSWLELACNP